jgi:integrase
MLPKILKICNFYGRLIRSFLMAGKTWKKTRVQFLWQNIAHGTYYARLFRDGKEHWKSLRTDVYSVAVAKLAVFLQDFRSNASAAKTVERGKATVENLSKLYLEGVGKDQSIKPATVHYRKQIVISILKTWPELREIQPRSVSEADCAEWATGFAKQYSPTRYNNAVDTLRQIFEVAIKKGLIYRNPAKDLSKAPVKPKRLELPRREEFTKVVNHVRKNGAWCSEQCGDLIEFLAYSGARLEEARNVRWADVENDSIWIHGGLTGTKNLESRAVPIIAPMRRLLDELKANPRYYRGDREEYVLAVGEAQKAIDAACSALAVKRFTHHDCRHMFATRAIESGVDVPTVARWLGHRDGGTLLMRTYSHLLNEHSQAMAAKMNF